MPVTIIDDRLSTPRVRPMASGRGYALTERSGALISTHRTMQAAFKAGAARSPVWDHRPYEGGPADAGAIDR